MNVFVEFGDMKMHPVERYAFNMWRNPDEYVKTKKKKANERKTNKPDVVREQNDMPKM